MGLGLGLGLGLWLVLGWGSGHRHSSLCRDRACKRKLNQSRTKEEPFGSQYTGMSELGWMSEKYAGFVMERGMFR